MRKGPLKDLKNLYLGLRTVSTTPNVTTKDGLSERYYSSPIQLLSVCLEGGNGTQKSSTSRSAGTLKYS